MSLTPNISRYFVNWEKLQCSMWSYNCACIIMLAILSYNFSKFPRIMNLYRNIKDWMQRILSMQVRRMLESGECVIEFVNFVWSFILFICVVLVQLVGVNNYTWKAETWIWYFIVLSLLLGFAFPMAVVWTILKVCSYYRLTKLIYPINNS